jgi:fructokinase
MRLGIDLGGTKTEIIAIDAGHNELLRRRIATPRTGYDGVLSAIAELVELAENDVGERCSVGVGIPGTISTITGLVKNANSTQLIHHCLDRDLGRLLQRPVRVANDANCFALSEAADGAGAGYRVVFGAILGTGVGGGLSVSGQVLNGAHGIAGEWGHNPLPAPTPDEMQTRRLCYCGKLGCIETWCSGPALTADFLQTSGRSLNATDIADAALKGDGCALSAMERFFDRLARALASVVNVIDPDVIVLGGGLSNIGGLYSELPKRVMEHAFNLEGPSLILKNRHGDSSGVRGAAWLWNEGKTSAQRA